MGRIWDVTILKIKIRNKIKLITRRSQTKITDITYYIKKLEWSRAMGRPYNK